MALCSALGETWLVVPQMSWTSIFRPAADALNAAKTKTIREHKILEAVAKVPDLLYSQALFPLTPALSLRERENQGRRCDNSKGVGLSNTLPMMLPLPEGEGRGEGEENLQIPESCDFCNRLSTFELLLAALARRRTRRAGAPSQRGGSSFGFRVSDFRRCGARLFFHIKTARLLQKN